MRTSAKKHTVIPSQLMVYDKSEVERMKESERSWFMSPEEHASVIAKYGPPKMPLKQKKKGGIPW